MWFRCRIVQHFDAVWVQCEYFGVLVGQIVAQYEPAIGPQDVAGQRLHTGTRRAIPRGEVVTVRMHDHRNTAQPGREDRCRLAEHRASMSQMDVEDVGAPRRDPQRGTDHPGQADESFTDQAVIQVCHHHRESNLGT